MKFLSLFGCASVLVVVMGLVPANAFALRNVATARVHSQTVHDRTPTVHTRVSHSHRG
jgi:ribosomal protein S11